MGGVIDQNKYDPSVGFAHSISADFSHKRHMSAGVAVVIRRKFGQPLAYQRTPDGAAVYILATKEKHFEKPSLKYYNLAFYLMQEHFQYQGLTILISASSPVVTNNISISSLRAKFTISSVLPTVQCCQ